MSCDIDDELKDAERPFCGLGFIPNIIMKIFDVLCCNLITLNSSEEDSYSSRENDIIESNECTSGTEYHCDDEEDFFVSSDNTQTTYLLIESTEENLSFDSPEGKFVTINTSGFGKDIEGAIKKKES